MRAYLCAVRTMLQHRSYPALQATERGSSRGKLSPLTVFWFLLYAQKERLRGERCLLCLCKRLRDAEGEIKLLPFASNPSVSLAADSLSLRLGHGAALICHRHIIHYRAATSLPLTQGSLWLGVASTTLSSKSRPGGRQEGRYCRLARYCSSRASSWAAVSASTASGSALRSSSAVRLPQVISTVGRPRFLPREISTWESPT